MHIDIFRRLEHAGNFSYLAVPAGQTIPNEVTNVDWEVDVRGVWLDDDDGELEAFSIKQPNDQISGKGYAISNAPDADVSDPNMTH